MKAAGGYPSDSPEANMRRMLQSYVDPLLSAVRNTDTAPARCDYIRKHLYMVWACPVAKEIGASAMTLAMAEQFPDDLDAVMRVPEYDTGLTCCWQIKRSLAARLDVEACRARWADIAQGWDNQVPYHQLRT